MGGSEGMEGEVGPPALELYVAALTHKNKLKSVQGRLPGIQLLMEPCKIPSSYSKWTKQMQAT